MKNRNKSPRLLKILKVIFLKDIKSQIHQINDLFSMILFDIISVFLFSSAIHIYTQSPNVPLEIFIIQIWIIIFFTLIFIMSKLFIKEKEAGTLDGLLTSPISSNIIVFSKILFCVIILLIIEVILFVFSFFFSAPIIGDLSLNKVIIYLLLGIILPTIDLSVCGTMVSAFSMYVKKKSFVLPILLFPILLPITLPIISLNVGLLRGEIILNLLNELFFIVSHLTLMGSILILISEYLLTD